MEISASVLERCEAFGRGARRLARRAEIREFNLPPPPYFVKNDGERGGNRVFIGHFDHSPCCQRHALKKSPINDYAPIVAFLFHAVK